MNYNYTQISHLLFSIKEARQPRKFSLKMSLRRAINKRNTLARLRKEKALKMAKKSAAI